MDSPPLYSIFPAGARGNVKTPSQCDPFRRLRRHLPHKGRQSLTCRFGSWCPVGTRTPLAPPKGLLTSGLVQGVPKGRSPFEMRYIEYSSPSRCGKVLSCTNYNNGRGRASASGALVRTDRAGRRDGGGAHDRAGQENSSGLCTSQVSLTLNLLAKNRLGVCKTPILLRKTALLAASIKLPDKPLPPPPAAPPPVGEAASLHEGGVIAKR